MRPSLPPLFALVLGLGALVGMLALGWVLSSRQPAPSPVALPERLLVAPDAPTPARPSQPVVPEPPPGPVGCRAAPPFTGLGHIESRDPLSRTRWLTHIPRGYDHETAHPILILLHQTNESPEELLAATKFGELADRHRWILLAPHSPGPWRNGAGDVARVGGALDDLSEVLCVDHTRVFVVGQGAGGRPALLLSCEAWVTAVAVNSFRPAAHEKFCGSPAPPKPLLVLSPKRTKRTPFNGEPNCSGDPGPSVAEQEAVWRARNGCDDDAEESFRHGRSRCLRWSCATPLESCHLDGGQGWPGSRPRHTTEPECDSEPPDFPTSARVWGFFAAAPPLTD